MKDTADAQRWAWIPLAGIPFFLFLYVVATRFYPGGSQADPHSVGFSWADNYWCNLLDKQAINGALNTSRPLAIVAMGILCICLSVFFYFIPEKSLVKPFVKTIVRVGGVAAMASAALMGVFDHDLMTNIASLLGVLAILGTLYILKQDGRGTLFRMGLIIVLLVGINNLFYYTDSLRVYLPVIQKATFLWVLAWVWLVSRSQLVKHPNSDAQGKHA